MIMGAQLRNEIGMAPGIFEQRLLRTGLFINYA